MWSCVHIFKENGWKNSILNKEIKYFAACSRVRFSLEPLGVSPISILNHTSKMGRDETATGNQGGQDPNHKHDGHAHVCLQWNWIIRIYDVHESHSAQLSCFSHTEEKPEGIKSHKQSATESETAVKTRQSSSMLPSIIIIIIRFDIVLFIFYI